MVGPGVVDLVPLPGPTRPRNGLGKAPAVASLDLHRCSPCCLQCVLLGLLIVLCVVLVLFVVLFFVLFCLFVSGLFVGFIG